MVICGIVKNSEKHLSAAQIATIAKEKLGKVALATVYNNLNALVSEGMIGRFSVDGKVDLYDKSPISHAHLHCIECGKVEDVSVPGFCDLLSQKTGKEVESFRLVIDHRCDKCRRKKK